MRKVRVHIINICNLVASVRNVRIEWCPTLVPDLVFHCDVCVCPTKQLVRGDYV